MKEFPDNKIEKQVICLGNYILDTQELFDKEILAGEYPMNLSIKGNR